MLLSLHFVVTARCVLVLLVLAAYLHFLAAVRRLFGVSVAVWSCLIMCTQFHFLFYASRPLPNSFAAVLSKLYGNKVIGIMYVSVGNTWSKYYQLASSKPCMHILPTKLSLLKFQSLNWINSAVAKILYEIVHCALLFTWKVMCWLEHWIFIHPLESKPCNCTLYFHIDYPQHCLKTPYDQTGEP